MKKSHTSSESSSLALVLNTEIPDSLPEIEKRLNAIATEVEQHNATIETWYQETLARLLQARSNLEFEADPRAFLTKILTQKDAEIAELKRQLQEYTPERQEAILNGMMDATHHQGQTPLMDDLTPKKGGAPSNPNSVRSLAFEYLRSKQGTASRKEIVEFIHCRRPDMAIHRVLATLQASLKSSEVSKEGGIWSLK